MMARRSSVTICGFFVSIAFAALVVAIPAWLGAQSEQQVIPRAQSSVAMVVALRLREGELVPVSSGSGTVVSPSGAVLTNYHVLFDANNNRLHDHFAIGLLRNGSREPELVCLGTPSKGRLKKDLDLALIRCDRDRSGVPWAPSGWPSISLRDADSAPILKGEPLWVLGYPGLDGSALHITAGRVSGFAREKDSDVLAAFIKTDASMTHGNSGGAAIDRDGNLVGVPTAFRLTTTREDGKVLATGRVGLIRPLGHALDLLEAVGTAPITEVVVSSRVQDASNGTPVEGALVVIFEPGIAAADASLEHLGTQALTWAHTDLAGRFRMPTPVPRGKSYTVAVLATGYLPRIDNGALIIAADSAGEITPWSEISLQPEAPQ